MSETKESNFDFDFGGGSGGSAGTSFAAIAFGIGFGWALIETYKTGSLAAILFMAKAFAAFIGGALALILAIIVVVVVLALVGTLIKKAVN